MMWIRRAARMIALGLTIGLAGAARGDDLPRVTMSSLAPVYPELARQMHLAGTVRVLITVSADGHVISARAIAGHPMLSAEAERCVKQWHFLRGPRASVFTVPVVFELE